MLRFKKSRKSKWRYSFSLSDHLVSLLNYGQELCHEVMRGHGTHIKVVPYKIEFDFCVVMGQVQV